MGRRRARGRSVKREGGWGGIQWIRTNIPVAGIFQDLGDTLTSENRKRTLDGVRGWMLLANTGSDAGTAGVEAAAKLMVLNADDALAITDDAQALDTNLEDIQRRQLWTFASTLEVRSNNTNQQHVLFEINVNLAVKLDQTPKMILGMLIDASVVNRVQSSGYLRAYYKYG